ncbi:MAG: 3-oxoacyl-[acyl-carrier-protein] reductase [Syntrophorhabdales bacterium]
MKGKVTIVTGASQGIGRAIAEFLAGKGSHIAIFDIADGADTVRAIEAKGVKAAFFRTDVSDLREVQDAVTAVVGELGGVDNLVNNAGITRDRLVLRMTEDDWDQVIRVNLKGVFSCTKAVLRHLLKKGGCIVNIASIAGLMGNPGQANYAASKAGIIGFTKTVAKEYGERGIRVNTIAPGFIRTDMTAVVDEKYRDTLTQAVPLGRAGEPVDVARVVYFLLSEYSSYITGETINVSGGLYT